MTLRRIATAASTIVVAIVVALAVPVSQLRTFSIVASCCCPDPSHCHCPDHDAGRGGEPSMRACHKTSHEVVSPEAPAAAVPELALATEPQRAMPRVAWMIAEPHAAPAPVRPDAPS
ncbi:MAG TPA: hypothetical protein VH143_09225 [Kofleriaceae bacterium]|nr:hypothetical protein [Kofleriaceae bacterium]